MKRPTRKAPVYRIIFGLISMVLLPSIAFGSGALGFAILADAAPSLPIPGGAAVEYLATKNIAYWFLVLAAIAIASWTYVFKWLIAQLELQREANKELQSKLLGYMEKDRSESVALQTRTNDLLERVLMERGGGPQRSL